MFGVACVAINYLDQSINIFIEGYCPKRKMSSIGFYQRNVLSLKQTKWLFYYLYLFWTVKALVWYLFDTNWFNLSTKSLFYIWYFKDTVLYEIMFLSFPLLLQAPKENANICKPVNFFMTKQLFLEPRRYFMKTAQESRLPQNVMNPTLSESRSVYKRYNVTKYSFGDNPTLPDIDI